MCDTLENSVLVPPAHAVQKRTSDVLKLELKQKHFYRVSGEEWHVSYYKEVPVEGPHLLPWAGSEGQGATKMSKCVVERWKRKRNRLVSA